MPREIPAGPCRPNIIRRFSDWPSRLEAAIAARARTPYADGAHDCCLAACDLICAQTGRDPARDLRGRYRTAAGALRVLRRFTGRPDGTMPVLVAAACERIAAAEGFPETAWRLARRGDAALVIYERGALLGVVDLDGRSILLADDPGWRSVPLSAAARCWRIG